MRLSPLSPRILESSASRRPEMPSERCGAGFHVLASTGMAATLAVAVFAVAGFAGMAAAGDVPGGGISCDSGELRAEVTDVQHGAGQTYAELSVVNVGRRSCELRGYPLVFQVDEAGDGLGPAAVAQGPVGPPVPLAVGGRAQAGLAMTAAGLFPSCPDAPARPAGLRVVPPGATGPLPVDGFAGLLPSGGGLAADGGLPSDGVAGRGSAPGPAAGPVAAGPGSVAAGVGCAATVLTELRVTTFFSASGG
ncbi:DUF4232 domain-containing protein [Parafrankia sp. EUN1f]|uniref:DUF4232 domain-containing protein n=1 Tax=Parafrankia sp. EUN1f TaxID=102897 RepID=UPI0001C450F4|nr:DUF4232 domain-containing protein [Parafrankia sp. EUN1f]EFC85176.1 hypothetical protein FrEUN1fDRAFT_1629 [Parafrankia sp. EUN1f]